MTSHRRLAQYLVTAMLIATPICSGAYLSDHADFSHFYTALPNIIAWLVLTIFAPRGFCDVLNSTFFYRQPPLYIRTDFTTSVSIIILTIVCLCLGLAFPLESHTFTPFWVCVLAAELIALISGLLTVIGAAYRLCDTIVRR